MPGSLPFVEQIWALFIFDLRKKNINEQQVSLDGTMYGIPVLTSPLYPSYRLW